MLSLFISFHFVCFISPNILLEFVILLHSHTKIYSTGGRHKLETFEMVLKVNLLGTFNMIRHVVEIMAKQPAVDEDGERGDRQSVFLSFHPLCLFSFHVTFTSSHLI